MGANNKHNSLSFDSYRRHFLSGFKKLSDSPPEPQDVKFRFDEYGDQIIKYITSEDLPMPITIGLNGEWGSGKTTLVKVIQKKIKENFTNTFTIECADFNAWDAEKSGIPVLLWYTIEKKLCPSRRQRNMLKPISTLLIDVACRKTIGMSYGDVKKHFEEYSKTDHHEQIKFVSGMLKNKRLIIFIDDLDRCDASNILEVLEIIKNLLNIKNIIYFITVDIKQIERAWDLKYGPKVKKIESKKYIDKLFPIILTLPPKSDTDIKEYVSSLFPFRSTESGLEESHEESMRKLRNHLVQSMNSNPRKIKRVLNTVFFIIQNLNNHYSNPRLDPIEQFERYFAFVITWVCIAMYHREIAEIIKIDPSSLVHISLLLAMFENLSDFKKAYETYRVNNNGGWKLTLTLQENNQKEFIFPEYLLPNYANDVIKTIISKDNSAFKPLRQIAEFTGPLSRIWGANPACSTQNDIQKYYSQYTKMLADIIEKGGLIGT